jgi:16S rRNA (guanine966-N2)-methyltransferase
MQDALLKTMKSSSGNKKAPPGRLRIVAGNWRSRVLVIADVPGLRPTPERVRETLFNWLAPRIQGARCLDVFAGTGALGFEALSRGAAEVMFVEKSRRAARMLEENAEKLGATGARIFHGDAHEFLRTANRKAYDVVFLDPPFAENLLGEVCEQVAATGILADGGVVYLEQDRDQQDLQLPPGWETLKSKTAGQVRYSLVRTSS